MTGLTRPALQTVPDEPEQVPRLARFRDEHPGITVKAGVGWWQAVVPEPDGETVLTRYLLRDLLDALAERFPETSEGSEQGIEA
jgi:hypothetical protein